MNAYMLYTVHGPFLAERAFDDVAMLRSRRELAQAAQNRPTWVVHEPPLNDAWGVHHSKLFLVEFERGVRLIVHTANLIHQVGDCQVRHVQGECTFCFPYLSGNTCQQLLLICLLLCAPCRIAT